MFHQSLATKSGLPNRSYSTLLYVWPHNEIIQNPHDHLFQKSSLEAMQVLKENKPKTVKTDKA